ncbi:MAG: DUF2255 family protein [Anaerolineales bacterium]|nr:DUF2255 family protein [Anaerolineales bacterium]MCX7756448.1 DUF2255 family protein [Anaerolineales bacterium]MDW8276905.1 DUF2255 family protein [Anaerolineales bacterium]
MTAWTTDELKRIGAADELNLTSMRRDGTLRPPVTIWVVRVDDNLYVRAVKGRAGPWFRGVLTRREGRIRSGGVEKDVAFVEEADAGLNDRIDAAYREKYRRYPKPYVDACVTPEARAATLKLTPRS